MSKVENADTLEPDALDSDSDEQRPVLARKVEARLARIDMKMGDLLEAYYNTKPTPTKRTNFSRYLRGERKPLEGDDKFRKWLCEKLLLPEGALSDDESDWHLIVEPPPSVAA